MTPADIVEMRIFLFGIPAICFIALLIFLRDLIVKPWVAAANSAIFVLLLIVLVLPFIYGLNLYEKYKKTDEYIERNAKKILAQQQLDSVRQVREARLEYVIENEGSTPYKNTKNNTNTAHNMARLQSEIDKIIKRCVECENKGESLYPDMTYEQGVRAAIEWMTGETNESPLEE